MISKTAPILAFLAAFGVTIALVIYGQSDRSEISSGDEPAITLGTIDSCEAGPIKQTNDDKEIRASLTDPPPCKGDLSCGCCCGITSIEDDERNAGYTQLISVESTKEFQSGENVNLFCLYLGDDGLAKIRTIRKNAPVIGTSVVKQNRDHGGSETIYQILIYVDDEMAKLVEDEQSKILVEQYNCQCCGSENPDDCGCCFLPQVTHEYEGEDEDEDLKEIDNPLTPSEVETGATNDDSPDQDQFRDE